MRVKTLSRYAVSLGLGVLLAHVFFVLRMLHGRHFAKYPQAAALWLAGELPKERLADFSPLYLWLHAAASRFFPKPGAWVLGAQALLTACSALLLLLLLRRFFSAPAAAAGIFIFSLCRGVSIYAGIFEPETALIFFTLGAAALLMRGGGSAPTATGLLVGLGLLLRPTMLPLLPLAPLFFRLNGRRGRPWLLDTLRFLVFPLLAVALLSAVNYRAGGGFSPMIMNPGDVFFEGNNPLSNGHSAVYPPLVNDLKSGIGEQPDRHHLSYRLVARGNEGREISPREVNAFWRDKAVNYIRDYPWRFMRLAAGKARLFLHGFRMHDVTIAQWIEADMARARIPTFPFGLVSALALPGLFLMIRRWRECWPAYAVVLIQAVVVMTFYASERQRLVAVPFLIFFAVATLDYLWVGGPRLLLLTVVLPLAFFFQTENDLMRDEQHRWENSRLSDGMVAQARRLREEGNFEQAARMAAAALASNSLSEDNLRPAYVPFPGGYESSALAWIGAPPPSDAPARLDQAVLLLAAGQPAQADAVLAEMETAGRRFNRLYNGSSEPAFYRGRAALAVGERDRAASFFRKALERSPGEPFSMAWLAALTGDTVYNKRLARYLGEADAGFLLGRANLDVGNAAVAVEHFLRIAEMFPEFRRGRIYLAAALCADGRYREAADAYQTAFSMGFEPLMREKEILSAFRALSAASPGERLPSFLYGTVLTQFGHFREALDVQRSIRGPVVAPEVEEEIRWLEWAIEKKGEANLSPLPSLPP